ncbi:MAG: pectate lyase [Phycisphaerae bacterium]|nr:pectate lyase [Phycisphaerae bacterium]
MRKMHFIALYLILLAATDIHAQGRINRDIAETLLLYQRDNGAWPKNYKWSVVDDATKKELLSQKQKNDTTIDNSATRKEIQYLARAYAAFNDDRYRQAALEGIAYLLEAQYANGGWPQYYPRPTGYHKHITFNDNAMIGVMSLLQDIAQGKSEYAFVDDQTRERAARAVQKGIDCILKCQVIVKGKKTAWCAQHHETTLEPQLARSYELASLSGAESVNIVRFLMAIEPPTPEITDAIESAAAWFAQARIEGIRVDRVRDPSAPGGWDRVVVEDASAPPLWARFYEIETNRPFFCSRDGIPRYRLSEISHERRNGYSWLGNYAGSLLKEAYPAWRKKHVPE